mmetsp:Transcript_21655/g.70002  ORF Transcript_21655/g.70002 Transcript_21655/m.70002 type:complete len:107 (-) Transcript_21655:262-582(-)
MIVNHDGKRSVHRNMGVHESTELLVIVVSLIAGEDQCTATYIGQSWFQTTKRAAAAALENEVKRRSARKAPIGRRIEAPPGDSPKKSRYHRKMRLKWQASSRSLVE